MFFSNSDEFGYTKGLNLIKEVLKNLIKKN